MAFHKFELDITRSGRDCNLRMDGEPVKGARAVTVQASVDGFSTITIEFMGEIRVTGEAEMIPVQAELRRSDFPEVA